jgi:hypothetical protein
MLWALWSAAVLGAAAGGPVTVEVRPAEAGLERAGSELLLNVDFVLTSQAAEELTVAAIELSVRDRSGRLELRKEVNSDGERPSIAVVGDHQLKPSEPVLIMNPFQRLDGALEAAVGEIGASGGSAIPHLHFELQTSADADGEGRPVRFKGFRRTLGARSTGVSAARLETGQIAEAVSAR